MILFAKNVMKIGFVKTGFYGFMKNATLEPTYARFDYIVIGGGTSGCALAATLSQNASVLVLERGGSPYDNPRATDIENFANTLLNITPNSWSQPFISQDGVFNTRARVLGGDSVLNAGFSHVHKSTTWRRLSGRWTKWKLLTSGSRGNLCSSHK